jgi:GNAT superfamily N-acetyltransferase
LCAELLASVPHWFGIAEANANYAAVAERSPTVGASVDGADIGFLTLVQHSEFAAEVYVMAVRPERHRQGVGTALLRRAEQELSQSGVEFLQVKTLAPSDPDEGYVATRAFYLGYGFRPLEVFPTLWDPDNPALQMVKSVPGATARAMRG